MNEETHHYIHKHNDQMWLSDSMKESFVLSGHYGQGKSECSPA